MKPRSLILLLVLAISLVTFLSIFRPSLLIENTRICHTLWYFRGGDQDGTHCRGSSKLNLNGRLHSSKDETIVAEDISPSTRAPNLKGTCAGKHDFPKTIHLLWKDKDPPVGLQPYVSSWKLHNPEWQVRIWDDVSLEIFLRKSLDLTRFEQWAKFPSSVGKTDVARLLLMQLLGGVYTDLDVKCYSCLNALLSRQAPEVNLLLPKEWSGSTNGINTDGLISNFWIASLPNASGITYLLSGIPVLQQGKWKWPNGTYFKDYDPDPNHNGWDGILNTAGPRYIQRRCEHADEEMRKAIMILPSQAWAALNKEDLWKDVDRRWDQTLDLKPGIQKFEIFGLHFHAGIWWHGPASDKFYAS